MLILIEDTTTKLSKRFLYNIPTGSYTLGISFVSGMFQNVRFHCGEKGIMLVKVHTAAPIWILDKASFKIL